MNHLTILGLDGLNLYAWMTGHLTIFGLDGLSLCVWMTVVIGLTALLDNLFDSPFIGAMVRLALTFSAMAIVGMFL